MIFVFLFLCGVDKTSEQLWVVRSQVFYILFHLDIVNFKFYELFNILFLAKSTFWSLHFRTIPTLVPKFYFYRF